MYKIILLLLIIKLSLCERRITNGSLVDYKADTSFVVYIVAAKKTDADPGWLCGGSIIHPLLVLTSAACLNEGINHMYVIAGYRKYVQTEQLDHDGCTYRMKKRIVSYCIHESHATEENTDNKMDEQKYKWLKFDIGVARIDSPIDFYDTDYLKYCSYIPSSIKTNYNSRYEEPNAHVVVYGWGHAIYYRPEGDLNDYNQSYLRYAASQIISRKNCQNYFQSQYVMRRIKYHFICTNGIGYFDASGKLRVRAKPAMNTCHGRRSANNTDSNGTCDEDIRYSQTRKNASRNTRRSVNTRRNGICQNDHGGPLVRWIGGQPYVIGVASAFQVNKKMECVGPYLYSSILCTSRFISCMLQEQYTVQKSARRTTNCDDAANGYKVEQKEIDWSYEDY